MKKHRSITGWLILPALAAACLHPPAVFSQGTAFTYQGNLAAGGGPASGIYDFEFTLYDAISNGNRIAGPLTNAGATVTSGLFTATLDFGAVFNGSNCWLQIAVRTNGADAFTPLSPLQALAPAPYAIYAANAASAASLAPGGGLSGAYSGALTLTNVANQFGGSFAGNGYGLSNLQAANLSGIVPPSSLGLDPNSFATGPGGLIIATNADLSVNLGSLPNLEKALASNVPPRFLWFGDSTGVYTVWPLESWLQNYSANHAIQRGAPFWGGPFFGWYGTNFYVEYDADYYWMQTGVIGPGTNCFWGGPIQAGAGGWTGYAPGNQVQIWMEASASNGAASVAISTNISLPGWTTLGVLDETALGAEGMLVVTNFAVPLGNYAVRITGLSGLFRVIGTGVIQTNCTLPIFYNMYAPGQTLQDWTNMGKNIAVILSNANPSVIIEEQTKPLPTYNDYTNFAWQITNFAPNSDVLLISSYEDSSDPPNGPAAGDNYQRNLFVRGVAITNHWPFVDVMTPMGSWSNIVAEGMNADTVVHLNSQGQDFLSQIVFQKLNLTAIWQEAAQASTPALFTGDLAIMSADYPNSGAQFGAVGNYIDVLSFNYDDSNWRADGSWSLGAFTAGFYVTFLKGNNGVEFLTSSVDPYGQLWQDGGWSFLDFDRDPHSNVDPGGPGVVLANTTTNFNLSFAGNGFASGATGVTMNITAPAWVNTNGVNGSIWVSTATDLAFFNSAGILVFGPVSVTNAAFPVGPGWTVTNTTAVFSFSAF